MNNKDMDKAIYALSGGVIVGRCPFLWLLSELHCS